jgi:cytochrome c oxidase subunit 2
MPESASEQGDGIQKLWSGFFLAACAVALLVYVLLIFVRYRRRPDDDELPSQSGYHIPLEITYTAIPIVMVAVLFTFSTIVERDVTKVKPDPDVSVEVIGFQWGWQFRYRDDHFTVASPAGGAPEMVLPKGQRVQLRLQTVDVNHSFWVIDFLSKRDLIPGVDNVIDVTPTRAGSFSGRCAEFCGLDHWRMDFSVRVVPPAEYQRWVRKQQAAGR